MPSSGGSYKPSAALTKGLVAWVMLIQVGVALGVAQSPTPLPHTPDGSQEVLYTRTTHPPALHSQQDTDEDLVQGEGGILSVVFPEGAKRVAPLPRPEEDAPPPPPPESSALPTKAVVKRSTDGSEGYMTAIGYDPMSAWAKRSDYDPGYESYMQSIAYDPMMAWGKRDAKRDGFDSYMQSIGYDPMMAWSKKDEYSNPYLQSVGYDPLSTFAKKTVKRSSETPVGYSQQDLPSRPRKRDEYADTYYPQHFFSGGMKKQDPYLDVYIPNHFMHSYKRSINPYLLSLASNDWKRAPNDMGAQGFHEGIFTHNFGDFSPVKRGKREAEPSQMLESRASDAASHEAPAGTPDSADLSTVNKRRLGMGASGFHGDTFSQGFGDFSTMKKRRLGMGASGFHGDTFSQGFGDFSTMKKRRMGMGASGFHGDTFSQGFGDFSTMKKRRLGMGASGFHGDTFSQGFGDFSTMKKRRLGMGASGFHGDTFSQGFGDFSTMKKRRLGMGASGFYGDTFSQGFGDFSTMKKRRMGMGASGFHGDTFSQGFGDFSTMKKRRMGMGASGFHGDTFSQGFGDFSTMKRNADPSGGYGDFPVVKKESDEEKVEQLEAKEKEGTRRKREVEYGRDTDELRPEMGSRSIYGVSDTIAKLPTENEMAMLQQMHEEEEEGRVKRNLEESDMLQVEVKPPIETDLSSRSRRYVQAYDVGGDTFVALEEDNRPLYKRSAIDWDSSSDMFTGGFDNFDTMKRRR
ncbi:uncharacterized protein [Panulirus ornatus]|uniref:uncharacterized protein n=1 Tax=Panulirus ornatus TaxID=150431 RepID=UPI003A858589